MNEEYDGQMRILVPEGGIYEPQITGQMTIEDVLAEWEKTRRAAAAALQEAEQKKLESAKARALQEAGDIMERLVDVIPKLDSGLTPQDLLKEQYLSGGEVEEDEAAQMVANMNQLLQREIDRLSTENAQIEEQLAVAQEIAAAQELAASMQELVAIQELEAAAEIMPEVEEVAEEPVVEDEVSEEMPEPLEPVEELVNEEPQEEAAEELPIALEEVPEVVIQEPVAEMPIAPKPVFATKELPKIELPSDINLEVSITKLSEEQKELFTYFTPIQGMEEQICSALSGIASRLKNEASARTGNLLVQGGSGSGKTVFATNFVKALQEMTGKPDGKVGKIDAETLNKKDINALYTKIAGGCLIVEGAGELTKDSAIKLGFLLEADNKGTLVILEDTRAGIEKALLRDAGFASKFTERINIPIFTNDELVVFAKAYAKENGYRIDEMGVLALYNSISNIEKLDKATSIAEVKEIVDDAIAHVESGTFRKAFSILTSSRFDEDDYVILHEKDFNI